MLRRGSYYFHSSIRVALPLAASSSLRRLLLYSTATAAPARFVAEDFLVATCGLTPAQALRSSKYLAHVKSSSNPEAVLAFFADIGLDKADVATAIARDTRLLLCRVEETLAPRIAQLRDIGLTPPQISLLITAAPRVLSSPLMISRLAFYLSFLGSYEKVHAALRGSCYFLSQDIERVVKPNLTFLQQYGLKHCDIAKLFQLAPRMIILEPERVKEIMSCAEKLGIPRDSGMFKHALSAICYISPGKLGSRYDFLLKALGCTEAEVGIAVRKAPYILKFSEDKLSRSVNFLKMEVGLEPNYIAHRPALLSLSKARRLVPRHFVLEALKAKGLVKKDIDFYTAVAQSDKRFREIYVYPYKECVPGLADAYAAACKGQCPPSILP